MDIQVSIITPCYNHGIYLDECIASIRDTVQSGLAEHIIVNDGSTDDLTLRKFEELEKLGYHIIHQPNLGLGMARNTAISEAKGKYILPLDADNKLAVGFIEKAVQLFTSDPIVDIIYGDVQFFGESQTYNKLTSFDIFRILHGNFIDACAIYKKVVWEKNKGYEKDMPAMGNEDWEFWINAYFNGFHFHYLPELTFYYRVRSNSMINTVTLNKAGVNRAFIFKKHSLSVADTYTRLHAQSETRNDKIEFIAMYLKKNKLKSLVKILFGIPI
jgi:glycosyltransferase involved in cell wall biosynthesis